MDNYNYEANSHRSRQEERKAPDGQRAEKVVKGAVTKKKRTVGSKIAEDVVGVKEYLKKDVLIPSAKKLIVDLVKDGIEMLAYGSTGRRGDRPVVDRVSYDKRYVRSDDRYASPVQPRARFDYDNIEFRSKDDADNVLRRLDEMIDTYGHARLSDLYDLIGESCDYTYNSYGWTNLSSAKVLRTSGGYVLDLPRVLPLHR
jgi:hypothetical protein